MVVERLNIGSFILCEKQRFLECLPLFFFFFLSSFLTATQKKKQMGECPRKVESTQFIESFANQIPGHVPLSELYI